MNKGGIKISPFSLDNKHILVTGASSGIGRKIAEILDRQGASLVLVGRNEAALKATLQSLDHTKEHVAEPYDLSLIDEIPSWIKRITSKLGKPLSGVVHCAGLHQTIPIRVVTHKNLSEIMSINLYAGLALLKGCSNKAVFSRGGSFIFISSVMGLVGQAGVVGYAASKGAIVTAVKSAALELASSGTRVNCICPGIVATDMADQIYSLASSEQKTAIEKQHPLGVGLPEDVAYAATYLLSDASKWVTGTSLVVDGGYTCH